MLRSLAGIQPFRSSTKVFLIPATPKRIVFALVTGLELAPDSLDDLVNHLPPNLILTSSPISSNSNAGPYMLGPSLLATCFPAKTVLAIASNSLNSSSSGHY